MTEAAPLEQPAGDRAGDLDALLNEFEASAGARADVATAPSAPPEQQDGNGPEEPGLTLDDLADPDSRYYRDREQAAYAQRVASSAQDALQQLARARDDADTDALLKEIRGDLDPELYPDKAIRAFIIGEAMENPSIHETFQQRASNPRAYAGLQRQLAKEFYRLAKSRPDPVLTEDRNIVAAAVRGASLSKAPESPPANYSHLSHNDFASEVLRRHGFNPLG